MKSRMRSSVRAVLSVFTLLFFFSVVSAHNAYGGSISGKVTGPDGTTPLEGIQATAYLWNGDWWEWTESDDTDNNGSYTISGLSAGTYLVEFRDWDGNYVSEYYDNALDEDSATEITVTAEGTVKNINASLAQAGKISGKVTGPDGTTPLEGIQAAAYLWNGYWWDWIEASDFTDNNGNYMIGGLLP